MPERRNLRTAADRIRHDLGRYATLQQRFLPEPASDEDLREALIADLGATRRGPHGVWSVGEVWAALAGERETLAADPGLPRVGAGVTLLADALPHLAAAERSELDRIAAIARDLALACRALGPAPG